MAETKCPKCDGEMRVGYILDAGPRGVAAPAVWIEGPFKKPRLFDLVGVYNQGKPITAYRCEKCGYLELYAR